MQINFKNELERCKLLKSNDFEHTDIIWLTCSAVAKLAKHIAWIWIGMTKRPGVTSDGNFSSYLIRRGGYGGLP